MNETAVFTIMYIVQRLLTTYSEVNKSERERHRQTDRQTDRVTIPDASQTRR